MIRAKAVASDPKPKGPTAAFRIPFHGLIHTKKPWNSMLGG